MATCHCEPITLHRDGVAVHHFCGEIFPSPAHEETLAMALDEAEQHREDAIVLDFSSVGCIDDAGFALVVELRDQAVIRGRRLLVSGLVELDADRLRVHGLAGSLFADPAAAVSDELAFRREVLCCA